MNNVDFNITTKASEHDDGDDDKHENVHEHDEENPRGGYRTKKYLHMQYWEIMQRNVCTIEHYIAQKYLC